MNQEYSCVLKSPPPRYRMKVTHCEEVMSGPQLMDRIGGQRSASALRRAGFYVLESSSRVFLVNFTR